MCSNHRWSRFKDEQAKMDVEIFKGSDEWINDIHDLFSFWWRPLLKTVSKWLSIRHWWSIETIFSTDLATRNVFIYLFACRIQSSHHQPTIDNLFFFLCGKSTGSEFPTQLVLMMSCCCCLHFALCHQMVFERVTDEEKHFFFSFQLENFFSAV